MRSCLVVIVFLAGFLLPHHAALAQGAGESLGKCLADNTTGKDRKDLARWIFGAMGAHPDMKSMVATSPQELEDVSRVAGALFTRLLAETCAKEARAAAATGGALAIQTGFQVLGQLAMQELMTNPEVGASVALLERFVDRARIDAALQAR